MIPPDGVIPGRSLSLQRVELLLGNLLRAGVILSVVLLSAGLVTTLVRHPDYLSDPQALSRLIAPGAAFPHTLHDLAGELRQGRGRALMTLGLLVLIATPILRVAVAAVAMLAVGDRRFALFSGVVLLVLVAAMLLGAV